MLVSVDISVFSSPTTAFANVWGELELEVVPNVGDEMSFLFKGHESMPPSSFDARMLVTSRRIDVDRSPSCAIQISDIVAEDEGAADAVCAYLERSFGLHIDRYLAV